MLYTNKELFERLYKIPNNYIAGIGVTLLCKGNRYKIDEIFKAYDIDKSKFILESNCEQSLNSDDYTLLTVLLYDIDDDIVIAKEIIKKLIGINYVKSITYNHSMSIFM